jgi:hypothetical protein
VTLLFTAACASIKTFDMPKVEDNLSRAFQKSEEVSAEIKGDFEQKKTLMESLRKGKSPKFKEIEPDLKSKMTELEKHLATAGKQVKAMMEAKGNISAISYSRKKVHGDEPQYATVDEQVRAFESAAAEFNQAAAQYSRTTNSLADMVAIKRLYFNFDVAEFQKKAQKALDAARENSQQMDREIKRTEDIRASFEDEARRAPMDQLLAQMDAIRKEHGQKYQLLANSMTEMGNLAQGQSKIPSIAANWNEVQRVVNDSERTSATLNELFKEFQVKVERVRSSPAP